ncbi:MAG: hypothetical protein Q7V43_00540 [Myxococcales bacterium]|nr:hypothetical protein [Myxococcales bacterium]
MSRPWLLRAEGLTRVTVIGGTGAMTSQIHIETLRRLDRALRRHPWEQPDEGAWRGRELGLALLQGLRDTLPTCDVATAVTMAVDAASPPSESVERGFDEQWSRYTLAWAARSLVAESLDADAPVAAALRAMAGAMAGVPLRVRGSAGADDASVFEAMIDATRLAFDGVAAEGYAAVLLQQVKHSASLLVVGNHAVDDLLRGAVIRSDRVAHARGVDRWVLASTDERRALAAQGLAEAAWALAARSTAESDPRVRRRLVRVACQLAARVDRVGLWVPPGATAAAVAAVSVTTTTTTGPAPEAAAVPSPKTERTMDEKKITPVLKSLEVDATDAAWRLAGSQFVKLAREPIVALLSRHLGPDDPSLRGRIAAFLDTEIGASLLSGVLSLGLSAMPLPAGDVSHKLARELRIRAMAGTSDVVADVLMGPLRQVAVTYLQGAGKAPEAEAVAREPAGLPGGDFLDALKTAAVHGPVESAAHS